MLFRIYDINEKSSKKIELDELVARIIAGNIPESFEFEALKAFAIIVRTELARASDLYGGKGCEKYKGHQLCTLPGHCIQFELREAEIPEQVRKSVEATKEKIMTFEGKPIKPYYHYRCGGATENSENVIGSRINYLRRVLCTYCKEQKDLGEDCIFDVGELEELLDTKIAKPDYIYNSIRGMFEDIDADDEGRIRTIKIGSKVFKGTEVMRILNLNSTRFNYTPVRFQIKTVGTGHGLGLCQCGANEMAAQGKTCEQILNYYYTGIELEEMQQPEEGKPLKGRRLVLDAGFGGEDCSDGRGPSGLREKDINLDIVLELRRLLQEDGAEVQLTREDDSNVPLIDRAKKSNQCKPDFFLSILQNTFAGPGVSGTEIYSFRGDQQGERLSKLILQEICNSLNTKNRGVRNAEFFLLREVKASAIIIQLLYITCPQDEARLADPQFRKGAAAAVHRAIRAYFDNQVQ